MKKRADDDAPTTLFEAIEDWADKTPRVPVEELEDPEGFRAFDRAFHNVEPLPVPKCGKCGAPRTDSQEYALLIEQMRRLEQQVNMWNSRAASVNAALIASEKEVAMLKREIERLASVYR